MASRKDGSRVDEGAATQEAVLEEESSKELRLKGSLAGCGIDAAHNSVRNVLHRQELVLDQVLLQGSLLQLRNVSVDVVQLVDAGRRLGERGRHRPEQAYKQ